MGIIAAEAHDKVPILETDIVHTQAGIRYRIIQTTHPGAVYSDKLLESRFDVLCDIVALFDACFYSYGTVSAYLSGGVFRDQVYSDRFLDGTAG